MKQSSMRLDLCSLEVTDVPMRMETELIFLKLSHNRKLQSMQRLPLINGKNLLISSSTQSTLQLQMELFTK